MDVQNYLVMDSRFHGNDKGIDLANFYAVEILDKVFHQVDPQQSVISTMEERLSHRSLTPLIFTHSSAATKIYYYQNSRVKRQRKLKILLVSGDALEQNAVTTMLQSRQHFVYQARNKEELIDLCRKNKRFDAVIVSDHFKEVGFGFFTYYFRQQMGKRKTRLIYLGVQTKLHGYDVGLQHPFLMEDLDEVLR